MPRRGGRGCFLVDAGRQRAFRKRAGKGLRVKGEGSEAVVVAGHDVVDPVGVGVGVNDADGRHEAVPRLLWEGRGGRGGRATG